MQVFYRYKALLEQNIDELAALVTEENGKVASEARAEVLKAAELTRVRVLAAADRRRAKCSRSAAASSAAIERYPVGVVASITPFNFPNMVPNWTHPERDRARQLHDPQAVGAGAAQRRPHRRAAAGSGAAGRRASGRARRAGRRSRRSATIPASTAISFVGSTKVAKIVYRRGTANLKRVLALGGAKNHLIVMPDADLGDDVDEHRRVDVRAARASAAWRRR